MNTHQQLWKCIREVTLPARSSGSDIIKIRQRCSESRGSSVWSPGLPFGCLMTSSRGIYRRPSAVDSIATAITMTTAQGPRKPPSSTTAAWRPFFPFSLHMQSHTYMRMSHVTQCSNPQHTYGACKSSRCTYWLICVTLRRDQHTFSPLALLELKVTNNAPVRFANFVCLPDLLQFLTHFSLCYIGQH